jgi:UDP-glucose 4-epimerase
METKSRILVTGGSGFIGTQVVYELHDHGHNVTTVDRKVKHWNAPGVIYEDDFLTFLTQHDNEQFDTIVHLAADHEVERSTVEPAVFYTNNVIKTKCMLDIMVARGIKNIIFSSSGSVYGEQEGPLTEGMGFIPSNPYASTKVAGEMLIRDYAAAYGLNYINFRYFNAVGADPKCRFGYTQRPATHVVPILCNKILRGEPFKIFGKDYPTKDGTCVRDYIHVADIARAHTMALDFLKDGNHNYTFNLGDGTGTSVKELVEQAGKVVGKEPVIEYAERRAGDPAELVADNSLASDMLGWKPKFDIQHSIFHAWKWENKFEGLTSEKSKGLA